MRIAMLTSTHPPLDVRIYHKEAVDLANEGHDVHIIAMSNDAPPNETGINFTLLPLYQNRFRRVLASFLFKRAALALDADVYVIHDPEILHVGRWLKKHGKPFIFDAFEPYPDFIAEKDWVPRPLKGIVKKLVACEEMRGAKASSGIISAMRENDERLSPAGKPSMVLHNYPRIGAAVEELPPKDNTIIFVGVVMAVRFGAEMLSLSRHLADGGALDGWKLQILGPVYGNGYLEECRESAGDFIDSERLYFPEKFVPYCEALSMMERAKIGLSFIVPTKKYNQCLSGKIFDYMAKGTIPITTWLDAYDGIVSDADGPIFVEGFDERRIVEIIRELSADKDAMRQRAEACIRSVREKFNWERDARDFPAFVEKCARTDAR
ncbi:MAG TPA: hypothetical protein ENN07_08815 [candidate division Zixibacteria bacterium]|nr:hypothetical protein [candidate division Zixibacteria bacterium]